MAVILTSVAPAVADTSKPASGTYKSMSSWSQECVPDGPRTTCTESSVDAWTKAPPMLIVCVNTITYTYSERTGRGRVISQADGCVDPVDDAALTITASHDQLRRRSRPRS